MFTICKPIKVTGAVAKSLFVVFLAGVQYLLVFTYCKYSNGPGRHLQGSIQRNLCLHIVNLERHYQVACAIVTTKYYLHYVNLQIFQPGLWWPNTVYIMKTVKVGFHRRTLAQSRCIGMLNPAHFDLLWFTHSKQKNCSKPGLLLTTTSVICRIG